MRAALIVAFAVAACNGTAWGQASSELAVQQKMETWTFWMMVTGAASAGFAFLGFVGVMLTLREQRRLAHAQEAARVEITNLKVAISAGDDEITVEFAATIENVGRTTAHDLCVGGDLSTGKRLKTHPVMSEVGMLAAGARRPISWTITEQDWDIKEALRPMPAELLSRHVRQGMLLRLAIRSTFVDTFDQPRRKDYKFDVWAEPGKSKVTLVEDGTYIPHQLFEASRAR